MNNLMKSDLYRAKKDKSLLVGVIVFAIYAVLAVLINKAMQNLASSAVGGLTLSFSGLSMFKSAYALTSDFGLLLPIFITTYIIKDFRYNTIRNKMAMGYSKTQIYLSGLFTAWIIAAILILEGSIVIGIGGTIAFGFGQTFNAELLLTLLVYVLLSFLLIACFVSITFLITTLTGSTGFAITFTIVIYFITSLLYALTLMPNVSTVFTKIYDFTIFFQSTELSGIEVLGDLLVDGSKVLLNPLTRILICSPIALVGINGLGIYLLKKKDLK